MEIIAMSKSYFLKPLYNPYAKATNNNSTAIDTAGFCFACVKRANSVLFINCTPVLISASVTRRE